MVTLRAAAYGLLALSALLQLKAPHDLLDAIAYFVLATLGILAWWRFRHPDDPR